MLSAGLAIIWVTLTKYLFQQVQSRTSIYAVSVHDVVQFNDC